MPLAAAFQKYNRQVYSNQIPLACARIGHGDKLSSWRQQSTERKSKGPIRIDSHGPFGVSTHLPLYWRRLFTIIIFFCIGSSKELLGSVRRADYLKRSLFRLRNSLHHRLPDFQVLLLPPNIWLNSQFLSRGWQSEFSAETFRDVIHRKLGRPRPVKIFCGHRMISDYFHILVL